MERALKYRVTAYESNPLGTRRQIVKREVEIKTTDPVSGKVLGTRRTKQQVRSVLEDPKEVVDAARDLMQGGYLVSIEDAQGGRLDEYEWTPLLAALLGSKPL